MRAYDVSLVLRGRTIRFRELEIEFQNDESGLYCHLIGAKYYRVRTTQEVTVSDRLLEWMNDDRKIGGELYDIVAEHLEDISAYEDDMRALNREYERDIMGGIMRNFPNIRTS
jgi:hypothetical protein